MRMYGSLSYMAAREIDDVGAVGLFVDCNGGVRLAFLRSKYLGTFEVEITHA